MGPISCAARVGMLYNVLVNARFLLCKASKLNKSVNGTELAFVLLSDDVEVRPMVNRFTKVAPFLLSAIGLVLLMLIYTGGKSTRANACKSSPAIYVNGELLECLQGRQE